MHQLVRTVERVGDAELRFENAPGIFATQRAHAVGFGRPREHARLERFVLVGRQTRRTTRLPLGRQGVEPAVAIGVAPTLREAAAASDALGDLRRGQPVDRQ